MEVKPSVASTAFAGLGSPSTASMVAPVGAGADVLLAIAVHEVPALEAQATAAHTARAARQVKFGKKGADAVQRHVQTEGKTTAALQSTGVLL